MSEGGVEAQAVPPPPAFGVGPVASKWLRFSDLERAIPAISQKMLIRPEYLMVRIRTRAGVPAWAKAVDVFLRTADESAVVGLDRE